MKPQLVEVVWDDAWVDGTEPVSKSTAILDHKPKSITTLGWVLVDDDAGISLANEFYTGEDTFRGRTFILRSMIRSVTPFSLQKPRRKRAGSLLTDPAAGPENGPQS